MNEPAELSVDLRREILLSAVQGYLTAGYLIARITDTDAELVLPAGPRPSWMRWPRGGDDPGELEEDGRMLLEVVGHGEVIARNAG